MLQAGAVEITITAKTTAPIPIRSLSYRRDDFPAINSAKANLLFMMIEIPVHCLRWLQTSMVKTAARLVLKATPMFTRFPPSLSPPRRENIVQWRAILPRRAALVAPSDHQ